MIKSHPMRVLSRPVSNVQHSRTPQPSASNSLPTLPEGVVVVGFISRSPEISSQVINRVLDSHVFGSGHLDKPFLVDDTEEFRQWAKFKKIRHYHEVDKGIVYLQFYSVSSTIADELPFPVPDIESFLGNREFDELRGLLFVFSVCHIVIDIQEGSIFDTQVLKKLKVLQAVKHAWTLSSRVKPIPSLPSRLHSLPTISKQDISSSHTGHTLLSPSHFIPVLHFVFVDEFPENSGSNFGAEESENNFSLDHSSSFSTHGKSDHSSKISGGAATLSRPPIKSESGFRKKLQSSLEAQIRFLIKKCRTLSGPDSFHNVSRSGATLNHAPLFTFDSSRAVTLIKRYGIQISESLECTIDCVEDVIAGKITSDVLLNENQEKSPNKEDIQVLKEIIHRQSDIVRGRGGSNSGSSPNVGMVAVAAAAAAAAASSGKVFSVPKLATLEMWMISSKDTLNGILSSKYGNMNDSTSVITPPNKQKNDNAMMETISSKGSDVLENAASVLECVRSLNTKFSIEWCEKSLPIAMDIYLKDLPPCYPTSLHEIHLEKALLSFQSMVRGSAVDSFAKKLELNCISLWKSGRQQCDAISLSGKRCMHKKHEVGSNESATHSLHSSGYFFHHACACGRSRCLRPDPFDLESVNLNYNCFPECDKFLPTAFVPSRIKNVVVQSSSWKLVRIGGSNCYDTSKGILQSGFSSTQRFLFKWTIPLTKPILFSKKMAPSFVDKTKAVCKAETGVDIKSEITQLQFGNIQTEVDRRIGILKKEAPNSTMRKFADVVAGSSTSDDSFPALRHMKSAMSSTRSSKKQSKVSNLGEESLTTTYYPAHKGEGISLNHGVDGNLPTENNISLRFGSHLFEEKKQSNAFVDSAVAYVGFEHECPRGHRFFLSTDNVRGFKTSLCSQHLDGSNSMSHNKSDCNGKDNGYEKHGSVVSIKGRGIGTSQDVSDDSIQANGIKVVRLSKDLEQMSLVPDVDVVTHSTDSPSGLLNEDLPLYMNCLYCAKLKNKKLLSKVNFADGISQLQRIFLVTPPLPAVVTTCPVIHFAASCLPESARDESKKLEFRFGCPVVLPPESFVIIRLPLVYGIQLEDGNFHPLKYLDDQPERTAWMEKGTALHVLSTEPGNIEGPRLP